MPGQKRKAGAVDAAVSTPAPADAPTAVQRQIMRIRSDFLAMWGYQNRNGTRHMRMEDLCALYLQQSAIKRDE